MKQTFLGKKLLEVGLVSTPEKAEIYATRLRKEGVDVGFPPPADPSDPSQLDFTEGESDEAGDTEDSDPIET